VKAAPLSGFVSGGVEGQQVLAGAGQNNEEIDLGDDDDDGGGDAAMAEGGGEDINLEEQAVPAAVFGKAAGGQAEEGGEKAEAMGAKDRFKKRQKV